MFIGVLGVNRWFQRGFLDLVQRRRLNRLWQLDVFLSDVVWLDILLCLSARLSLWPVHNLLSFPVSLFVLRLKLMLRFFLHLQLLFLLFGLDSVERLGLFLEIPVLLFLLLLFQEKPLLFFLLFSPYLSLLIFSNLPELFLVKLLLVMLLLDLLSKSPPGFLTGKNLELEFVSKT